jgi:PAS domain S-box-containing protein
METVGFMLLALGFVFILFRAVPRFVHLYQLLVPILGLVAIPLLFDFSIFNTTHFTFVSGLETLKFILFIPLFAVLLSRFDVHQLRLFSAFILFGVYFVFRLLSHGFYPEDILIYQIKEGLSICSFAMLVSILYNNLTSDYARLHITNEDIVKHSPIGIVTTDVQGNIISFNPVIHTYLGSSILKRGRNIFFVEKMTCLDSEEVMSEVVLKEKRITKKGSMKLADGKTYYFDITITPLKQRDRYINGLLFLFEDVTEKVNLEKKVFEARDYLEKMFITIPIGILTVDNRQRITSINPAGEKLLGYSARELTGKTCDAIEGYRCPNVCSLFSREAMEPVSNVKCTVVRKDGETITVLKSADVIRNKNGDIIGGIEAFRDISDIIDLENKLGQTERMAALGTLAAEIAHEMKNNMIALIGHARILPKNLDAKFEEKALVNAKIIEEEAYKIEKLANSLMNFSALKIDRQRINIHHLIERVINLLNPTVKFQKVNFLSRFCRGIVDIYADPLQLQQVFINLFNNSAESMNSGEICVTTRYDRDARIVTIHVRDNGSGISSQKIGMIFKPHITTKEKGHGFGLPIAYRIISSHGGTIQVKSTEGVGTEFTIIIPAGSAKESVTVPDFDRSGTHDDKLDNDTLVDKDPGSS